MTEATNVALNEIDNGTHQHEDHSAPAAAALNRRAFLQMTGLAAGAATIGGGFVGASTPAVAQAMNHENYPAPPKLTAQPLKASTLATEGISRRTHEEHFKLYQGYVNKSNELFEKIAAVSRDPKNANQTYSEIREMKVELSFALGGVKNHELYIDILGKSASRPSGELLAEINRSFGSLEKWQADLKATGLAGRGWAWTAYDHDLKRLMNYIGDAQNSYPIWNATPIVGLDVYEHAYYLDFATNRGAYIDAFVNNLNWDAISRRFLLAMSATSTLVTPA
jgi:Fe-Mn family superoxide dismutase